MGSHVLDPAKALVRNDVSLHWARGFVMALRRASKGAVAVAMVLAYLAGCVDAIGFSELGGLFVSFMSGNSTRFAIFLASGDRARALEVGAIILAFVSGAGVGSIIGRTLGSWRQTIVLALEATALAAAGSAGQHGLEIMSAVLMAGAMGLENAVFASPMGETTISLTFMTGALVKIGEGVAVALLGGSRWSWLPFLLLWISLVLGAVTGALCYGPFGVTTLYGVSTALAILALGSVLVRRSIEAAVDAPKP